jgi:hypothetical protein
MRHGFLAPLLPTLLIPGVAFLPGFDPRACAAGTWPTDGVGICAGPGAQGRTGLVPPDGSGAIYVTWQEARAVTQNIYALRIDSSGQPAPACRHA